MLKYQISSSGILYIRKLGAHITYVVETDKIPADVVSRQERNLVKEINNKSVSLPTLVAAAIKNVGPVAELILAALGRIPL